MAVLVTAMTSWCAKKDVDARAKPVHDEFGAGAFQNGVCRA